MKMQELCMSMLHKIWFMWCDIYSLHNIDYSMIVNITSFTISIMKACATDYRKSIYRSLIMLDSIWGIISISIFKLNNDFNNLLNSIPKLKPLICLYYEDCICAAQIKMWKLHYQQLNLWRIYGMIYHFHLAIVSLA